jgi:hypothetical protein
MWSDAGIGIITGDLAFCATALGKEGMDKTRCLWRELERAKWQSFGHDCGVEWTLQELKRVASSLHDGKAEIGVKSHPQLDCVQLERFVFPALHATLGPANRLLKHTVDCAGKVVERTPQLLKDAQINQVVTEEKTKLPNKRQQVGDVKMAPSWLTRV